jgi:uncharacterized protein YjdB
MNYDIVLIKWNFKGATMKKTRRLSFVTTFAIVIAMLVTSVTAFAATPTTSIPDWAAFEKAASPELAAAAATYLANNDLTPAQITDINTEIKTQKAALKTAGITTATTYGALTADQKAAVFKASEAVAKKADATITGSLDEFVITNPKGDTISSKDPKNQIPAVTPVVDLPVTKVAVPIAKVNLVVKKSVTVPGVAYEKTKISKDKLTYKTNKASVATVKNGKITAKKAGKATITITASNGKKATIAVTVVKKAVKVKKITATVPKTVKKGAVAYVTKIAASPAKATATGAVKITSSNKKIAKVTANGAITGVKKGTAKITIKYAGKTVTKKITVK